MIDVYHATVGSNAVMELDFAIDRDGLVADANAARYTEKNAAIFDGNKMRSFAKTGSGQTEGNLDDESVAVSTAIASLALGSRAAMVSYLSQIFHPKGRNFEW
jgi:hypothetical protein